MSQANYPTIEEIRSSLVDRSAKFTKLTGTPRSTIGKESVHDPAFISRVASGEHFTTSTYDRVMKWLDANWPDEAA